MAPQKSIDMKNALNEAIPALTRWTFVRAAGLSNLLVSTAVFVEFSAIALVDHDGRAFLLGLLLIPLMTVVIWGTAAVLCVLALAPRRLWTLGRCLLPSGKSGLWDDWLDSPEPHHP
jgi:hypothetical protein